MHICQNPLEFQGSSNNPQILSHKFNISGKQDMPHGLIDYNVSLIIQVSVGREL